MDNHEFGIMKNDPIYSKEYVEYEPRKYNCISVNDEYIQPLLEDLNNLDCYWHSLERPEKNLAYTGITLIPPSSLEMFLDVIKNNPGTDELEILLKQAKRDNKFVIHYGL